MWKLVTDISKIDKKSPPKITRIQKFLKKRRFDFFHKIKRLEKKKDEGSHLWKKFFNFPKT